MRSGVCRARAGTSLAVTVLVATLGVGCSDGSDEEVADPTPTPSAAVSTATTDEGRSTVDDLVETGLAQVALEDYRAARAAFASVLALDPDNVAAIYNLGFVAEQRGDTATAITQYVAALDVDADFTPALYNLARLTERSDLPAAVGFYRRVLEIDADDTATLVRLGFALQHLGRVREGRRLVERGIDLDPSLADVKPPTYD